MGQRKATKKSGKMPCLFLSHSGADTTAARELKRRILSSPTAQTARLKVWLDADGDLMPGSTDWQRQIEDAIECEATAFAVYVGSKGVVNWVEREVRLGLSRATGEGAIPFVPILALDSLGSKALPAFARQHQAVRDPLGDASALAALISAVLGAAKKPELIEDPFVGLRSMTENEADRFFGRSKEIDELIDRMKRFRLVTIVAESGSGKSSLAQAGLIPRFRGGAFEDPSRLEPEGRIRHVLVMRPQADPVQGVKDAITRAAEQLGLSGVVKDNLHQRINLSDPNRTAEALRCDLPIDATETLLVVDQFEELFTQTQEPQRKPFIDLLLALLQRSGQAGFRILLTMRSDYFNNCLSHEGLAQALSGENADAKYPLKRISNEGIAEAVRRPLEMAGHNDKLEQDALISLVERDTMDRPGDLALIQMALHETWQKKGMTGGDLINAYAAVGGVPGAFAAAAKNARDKLKQDAALLLPIFVRLIRLGTTGGVTRRVASLDEFDQPKRSVISKLAQDDFGRLLQTTENTVEVAHEALITQWAWLNNEINVKTQQLDMPRDIRRLERLMEKSAEWHATDSQDRLQLASFAELDNFKQIASDHGAWLSAGEQKFVQASVKSSNLAKAVRLALRTAVLVLLGLISVAAFYLSRANMAANELRIAALRNESAALAALSAVELKNGQPAKALKLALAAWPRSNADDRPQFQSNINAVGAALIQHFDKYILTGHQNFVTHIAWSPDGTRLATASSDNTGRVWNAATGQEIAILKGLEGKATHIAWSPDGTRLATASPEDTGRVWNAATGQEIAILKGHEGKATHIAWSPDGTRLATASPEDTGRVWNAATGQEIAVLRGLEGKATHIAWSPDGTRLATVSQDNTGRVWNAATGQEIAILKGHEDTVIHIAWSPDGTRLATASWDKTGWVWDAATGQEIAVLRGHEGTVIHIAWSPDGTRLATASQDKTGRVWDAAAVPQGGLFDITCTLLSERGLSGLSDDIQINDPICDGPPATPDWAKIIRPHELKEVQP